MASNTGGGEGGGEGGRGCKWLQMCLPFFMLLFGLQRTQMISTCTLNIHVPKILNVFFSFTVCPLASENSEKGLFSTEKVLIFFLFILKTYIVGTN